ncbi:hypothetical protein GCM10020001_090440 [Nonomuraea salmonea]
MTVVDGGYPGEATQAGAGIVCPWVDHPEDDDWYRLTREGARHYPGLVEELGEDIGYAKVGALLVAEDPVDLEPVRALLRRRYAGAPEMGEVVDVATPAELFPPLSDTLSALLVPGAARVDGRSVRDALLAAAVARGAEVRTGTATLTQDGQVLLHPADHPETSAPPPLPPPAPRPLRNGPPPGPAPPRRSRPGMPRGGRRRRFTLMRRRCPASSKSPWVRGCRSRRTRSSWRPVRGRVRCAGRWASSCRSSPRRGQILHATLEGVDTAWWPIILPRMGPYLLGFPDSRVVVGATVEDVGFAPRVTVGGLDEVIEAGLRVAPGLASATVSETRVGLRPVYAPGSALIGPVTDRVVVATGLSAYGLTAGPFTGELAAALALGERPPIDLAPYRPPTG